MHAALHIGWGGTLLLGLAIAMNRLLSVILTLQWLVFAIGD